MPNSIKGQGQEGASTESLQEVMDMVANVLTTSKKYFLEAEVFATALIVLKENPELSIEEALEAGLSDWDI